MWDEEKDSDNDKEYAEPIRICGDGTWEIINCAKEIRTPISGGILAMAVVVVPKSRIFDLKMTMQVFQQGVLHQWQLLQN